MYNWKTVLLTLGVLVGLKIWSPYLVENIKWSYFDVLHQQKESQHIKDIVLVDIDEKSLDKYGQYPWDRNIYSDIMLENHHTNTHVFTQVFNQPDRFGGDVEFATGLVNRLSILSAGSNKSKGYWFCTLCKNIGVRWWKYRRCYLGLLWDVCTNQTTTR